MLKQISEFCIDFFSIQRFIIFSTVIISCFILEIILLGWENSSLKKILSFKSKSVTNDLFSYLFKLTNMLEFLGVIFSFGLSILIPDLIGVSKINFIQNNVSNIFIQNIIFILALDFTLYWTHRALHNFRPFWELHKFHHSATEMTIMTTARLHPLEIAINSVMFSIPIFFLGFPIESYIIFFIITSWLGHIQHSNIKWNFGFIGEWIFISPSSHRIHHSSDTLHFNKNFGTVTPVWDKLFGTWENTKSNRTDNIVIGIPENHFNDKNVIQNYLSSVSNFINKVFNGD